MDHSLKMVMSRLGHVLMAFHKRLNHSSHLIKPREDDLVAVNKALVIVLDPSLLAELLHETLCLAQIVPWQPWE